jgi:hypothetical protein
VKPGVKFLYFDPVWTLSKTARERWALPEDRQAMISDALVAAGE